MVELPLEGGVVKRGTPVTVTVVFNDDPLEVLASFIRPQQARAVIDPGYVRVGGPREGSRIRRLGLYTYSYVIDTTGFENGRVTWHIWGTGDAHEDGWFIVESDRPPQLL